MDNNVFNICEIPTFIDIKILKKYINDYIKSNYDFLKERYNKLYIDHDRSEYFIMKATKGKFVGSGNDPVDIIKDKNGIDVACLSLNKNITNEKSIIQNFTKAGNELDNYFNNKEPNKAIDLYKKILKIKYENAMKKHNIENLYYLIFLYNEKHIYLIIISVNINKCDKITGKLINEKTIDIDNFIDKEIGNVKLYKSKKRLELRLYSKIINNKNCILII